jgi:hypothetical protein
MARTGARPRGLRSLLDDNLFRPAFESSVDRERQLMALPAGLICLDERPVRAAAIGRVLPGREHTLRCRRTPTAAREEVAVV